MPGSAVSLATTFSTEPVARSNPGSRVTAAASDEIAAARASEIPMADRSA
jgi:hypothetical protein